MSSLLDRRLNALESMDGAGLRAEWERVYGLPAPKLSPDLLKPGIAYRLQEKALGGLGKEYRRALIAPPAQTDNAKPAKRKLTTGTRLVRDWHGTGHTVTVVDEGFEYDGERWTSLTAIARHITGAKWSGPRFFGLTGAGS